MINKQNKSKRGGARPGAGRRVGSTSKISGVTILAAIETQTGRKFEDLLAQGYHTSIIEDDKPTRLQYEKMFLSKVVADKVDITSDGQSVLTQLIFDQVEIDDWKDSSPSTH